MSTSHLICRRDGFEFNIDEHSNRFDLAFSKSADVGGVSASIELNDFTVDELETICLEMMRVLSYYHNKPEDVIDTLFKEVPEYDKL